ncbi:ParB/RepB/Spo0J family partition protein [Sinorhizobium medicae]|nr:ParB/RepB/Spo0J family partition protein [Sinorhizobium medicae]
MKGTTMTEQRRIDKIKVGPRFREDLGDLASLAENIRALGLLQPIGVTPSGWLLWGERRLRACRSLGWRDIPVIVRDVDSDDMAAVEAAENFARKDFTLSEAVAIKRALQPNLPKFGKSAPAREQVATATGFSHETLRKAEAVVSAAENEPVRFGKLLADMDRTGRVDGPFKRLNVAKKAEAIRAEPPPLPQRGPYRVIVADPPWPYEIRQPDPSLRAAFPYPTMSIADICALDVASIAHTDSILWLWTTNHHLREAFRVVDAWGFEQKTMLTWGKDRIGYGDWLRGRTEHCLFAVRGKPVVEVGALSTLLLAPAEREHSRKPDAFYELVERLCPAPRYAELFQRRGRPKWDGHGDEVARTAAE